YIFEPDREQILSDLIPKSLRTQAFRAVLESNAAEQGARMVAMDTATENAEELLKSLRISYNKARQAAITTEILEISAGANALADG
ncbi:MAG: FoF1 ATP synthase subunit gamma, partial [Bacteroidota bacterium]